MDKSFVIPAHEIEAPHEPQCAVCERPLAKASRCKELYGYPVCRKCRHGFANRRQAAFLIDWVLCRLFVLVSIHAVIVALLQTPLGGSSGAYLLLALKDGFSGKSPGRWLLGLRVVDAETRLPIGFRHSFVRNLPLFIPYLGVLGIALSMMSGLRWGDR